MSIARKPTTGTSGTKAKKSSSKSSATDAAAASKPPTDDLDSLDTEALSDLLRSHQTRLHEVRRHRNYYQLEKDQIQTYYDIVRDELTKTEAHLRNIEAQMEKMQDTHRNDIRIYLQKVIHLEYEHENNITSIQVQSTSDKKEEEKQHETNKKELKDFKLQLKSSLHKTSQQHEEEIKRLKEIERKEMTKLREQFERNYQDLLSNYETRLSNLKDDLELRKKLEIHEIEERKNRHINDLMIHHSKNFEEMRSYYNSITQDNLDLIKELNNEIEDLKLAHIQNERAMEQIEKKNVSLAEPLIQAETRVRQLQHKLLNYSKDKLSLKHARSRLIVLEEQYKNLQESHGKLRSEYNSLDRERLDLYTNYESTISSIQKKSATKNEQLELILEDYSELFQIKKSQFTSVLKASNLDPLVLSEVTKKLDDVLSAKNEQLDELKYEQVKLIKAINDLIRTYEAKFSELGVPQEERNLEPFITQILTGGGGAHGNSMTMQPIGTNTAPADLIVQ